MSRPPSPLKLRADGFLASPEASALGDVPADARAEVARRLLRALAEIGEPLERLGASEAHGWLLHAVPERFRARDPLAPHVAPVVRALVAHAERTSGRELGTLRGACEELLPELEAMLAGGGAHHHHDHAHEPKAPYVRDSPRIGRNDPCPCGSGKKYKKCHGA